MLELVHEYMSDFLTRESSVRSVAYTQHINALSKGTLAAMQLFCPGMLNVNPDDQPIDFTFLKDYLHDSIVQFRTSHLSNTKNRLRGPG